MALDAPDWTSRVNIVAQDLASLIISQLAGDVIDVNILAQELAQLIISPSASSTFKVDVIAQTLSALNIKPTAESQFNVNLAAQTLDSISIAPTATSTFKTDIVAQSMGNVNVAAGTVGGMDIDINSQSLNLLLQSPSYGTPTYTSGSQAANPGETKTLINISGKGIIYSFIFNDDSSPNQGSLDQFKITIDGNVLYQTSFSALLRFSGHGSNAYPTMTFYDIINGDFNMVWPLGLTFNTSIKIEFIKYNDDSAGATGTVVALYALRA
jgi:hypothetical protein